MTGRIAKKNKRSKADILFEIRSANPNDSWKRWVRMSELHEVYDTTASKNVEFAADLIDAIRRAVAEDDK